MRRLLYLLVGMTVPSNLLAQSNGPDSSNVIDDVVIQEKAEVVVEEEKIPLNLKLDFSNLVKIDDRITWASLDELIARDTEELDYIDLKLANPALSKIRPAPVKIFHAQFRNVARWQLDITTTEGLVFRTLTGDGTPPKRIEWDGLSNTHELLRAGDTYSYRLTAFDKAGNKRTFPGKSFSVPAFYVKDGERLFIGISGAVLFSEETFGLTDAARDYAQEAAGLIRYSSRTNDIAIETNLPNVEEFLGLLSEELNIDRERFHRLPPSNKLDASILIHVK
ncbi:hypothetical protein MJD09_20595 [bacterium]|nr:hypothetical protein [bacterium]